MTYRFRIAAVAVLAVAWCAAWPRTAVAQGARFAVLIQGASGEEEYAVRHRAWLDALTTTFRSKFNYDGAHLIILAEQPKAGEGRATAENVNATFAKLAATMTAADQLSIVLIGHGSADGGDAKFNLIGPDLSVSDWAGLLKPVKGRIVFVDTTSASFPFLAGLAAPGRIVVTATSASAQRFQHGVPEGLRGGVL